MTSLHTQLGIVPAPAHSQEAAARIHQAITAPKGPEKTHPLVAPTGVSKNAVLAQRHIDAGKATRADLGMTPKRMEILATLSIVGTMTMESLKEEGFGKAVITAMKATGHLTVSQGRVSLTELGRQLAQERKVA